MASNVACATSRRPTCRRARSTIRVAWSSVNYKDGLATIPTGRVARISPLIPGIDLAGEVVESADPGIRPGELVIAHGYELGVSRHGGFAEYQRVPAGWVVPLPASLTPRLAMAVGTAGFTAALSFIVLEQRGLRPGVGPVLVTGASGGLGGIAVGILATHGYEVWAATGKPGEADRLRRLGAAQVISRADVTADSGKSLDSERWAGAIDCVGGATLPYVLRTLRRGATVAASGNTGGPGFTTTVFPFILRSVALVGIDFGGRADRGSAGRLGAAGQRPPAPGPGRWPAGGHARGPSRSARCHPGWERPRPMGGPRRWMNATPQSTVTDVPVPTAAGHEAPASRRFATAAPIDLRLVLGIHGRGGLDPTLRFSRDGSAWRATRTPAGPATIRLVPDGDGLRAEAWGPGAAWAIQQAPELVGADDDPGDFAERVAGVPLLRELARRMPGLRIGHTRRVLEALVPAIIEQKVTGSEAWTSYVALVRRHGEPAPGPWPASRRPSPLRIPPSPETLAGLPGYAYHPLGLERRRADAIRGAAAHASRLEECADLQLADAYARLRALPLVGPWTAAEVGLRALGDPDAVSLGDFHLPHVVCWALAGEPRGSDARMLELLAPFTGHRARVIRLLEAGRVAAPRRGPRMPGRDIRGL